MYTRTLRRVSGLRKGSRRGGAAGRAFGGETRAEHILPFLLGGCGWQNCEQATPQWVPAGFTKFHQGPRGYGTRRDARALWARASAL